MNRAATPSSLALADALFLPPDISLVTTAAIVRRLALVACVLACGSPVKAIAGGQAGPGSAAAGRQTPMLVAAVKGKPKPADKATSNPEDDFRACRTQVGEEAFTGCDRAIASGKLNQKDLAFAYASRGADWSRKGDVEQALADLNQAIRLNPTYQYAYIVKARLLLLARKDPSAALAVADQAIEAKSDSYAYAIRGQALQELGRNDEAATDYKRTLADNPGTMERQIAEGGLADLAGIMPAENFKPLPPISESGPPPTVARSPDENTAANADAANCRTSSGEAANAACDRAIASGRFSGLDLAQLLDKRGGAYRAKQDFDHAIADYSEGLRQIDETGANKSGKTELLINRGVTYLVKKDFDRAIADMSAAIDIDPSAKFAFYNRGVAHRAKQNDDLAIADFSEAIRLDPHNAMFLLARADDLRSRGRRDEAAADYKRVLEENSLKEERQVAEAALAGLAAASAKPAESPKPSPSASGPSPSPTPAAPPAENTAANADAASCRTSSGDAAIAACDRAIASGRFSGRELAQLLDKRGNERAGKQDWDGAIEDYSAAIKADPKNALAFSNRSYGWYQKKDYQRTLADENEAIRLGGGNAANFVLRGEAHRQLGHRDEAVADYYKGLNLNPDKAWMQTAQAGLRALGVDPAVADADAGRCRSVISDEMLAACDRAIGSGKFAGSELSLLLTYRCAGRFAKGDYDHALADCSEAVRADPNHGYAHIYRARAMLAKSDLRGAIVEANEGVRLVSGQAQGYAARVDELWDELWGYVKAGIPGQALGYAARGDVEKALGRSYEARADYEKAVNLKPDGWVLEIAQAGLAALASASGSQQKPSRDDDADPAGDFRNCIKAEFEGRAWLAACGRAIASNKFAGKDLTELYDLHADLASKVGEFDLAIADYGALLKIDPKFPKASRRRGDAYYQKGEHDKAIADYSQALLISAYDEDALIGRGNAYLAKQDYDHAIADYSRNIQHNAEVGVNKLNNVDALINRGVAYLGKDDADRAIADFSAALAIDGFSAKALQALLNRGAAYAMKQHYDLATADLSEAIRKEPRSANAVLNLKMDLVSRKQLQEAVSAIDDDYKRCHAGARDATVAACGKVIAAHKFTGAALADLYDQRGGEYYEKRQYELALADFDEAIRLDPSSVLAFINRGFTDWATKKYDRAIADFSEAIKLQPANDGSYVNRGQVYAAIGDREHAIADFSAAIQINPDAATYVYRGDILRQAGRRAEAAADYNKALALKADDKTRQAAQAGLAALAGKPAGDDDAAKCRDLTGDAAIATCGRLISSGKLAGAALAGAYNSRGAHYYDKGQYDLALADIDKAIQLDPSSAAAYVNRGFVDVAKKNSSHAIADFSEVIRLRPDASLAYLYRGNVYANAGDQAHAIADYGEAIRLDPKLVGAYYDRGDAYVATKEFRLAFADYKTAVHLDPKYVIAATTATIASGKRTGDALMMTYDVRALAYSAIRDYDHAIADLSEEIRLDPKDAEAYSQRGEARSLKGQHDEAIADLSAAIAIDPADADNLHLRGLIYDRKHDLDRAIADYSAAIAIDPKFAGALSDRGGAFFDKGDYDRAIADYNAVIKLRPTAGQPHTEKAQALLAKKQTTEALAEANEGVRLTPDDKAFAVRGDVFRILGRATDAKADYDKALSINQGNKIAAKGLNALAAGGPAK